MNKIRMISALSIVVLASACSQEESIEAEVSTVTDEGPWGGYSVKWYKAHWNTSTTDQRRWCRRQEIDTTDMLSCTNADIGWKQGWSDPVTNPQRRWEDGSKPDE